METAVATATLRRRPTIVLCGDSLTQLGGELGQRGWALLLQQAFLRSVDVVNRGLSGYNTTLFVKYALPVICEELRAAPATALVTLWLGANDAALASGPSSNQHVPVDDFRASLELILKAFQAAAPQTKLLLIAPPVVGDDQRRAILVGEYGADPSAPLDRTNEQAAAYAAACREAAAHIDGVALLDMHAFLMAQYPEMKQRAALLCDGLHFTSEGNQVVFERIKKEVEALLPAELLETWQLPDWKGLQ